MARDTVTVPSILDRVVKFDDCETPEPRLRDMIFTYYMMGLNPEHALAKRRAEQFIAALTSSDPEGGARGVQGSIATKQATDLTSALATETALEILEQECWDLRCVNVPTGGDDYDIGWRVIEHYQAEPQERIIGYGNSPLEAMRDALETEEKRRHG